MTEVSRVVRNQTRGITGALVVAGVTILLTAETWWLAWERPAAHLIVYSVVGLGVVLLITRTSGFRVEEEDESTAQYHPLRLAVDFAQLVLQTLVATVVVLWMYGIVDSSSPPHLVARMGLMQVVPLGFGAALANQLLHEMEDQGEQTTERRSLPTNVAVFAAGAIFFSLPLGASIEMNILAASAGWLRHGAIVAVSLATAYLVLYELEFRGQARRTVDHEQAVLLHAGQVCLVYAVGLAVSVVLLWGFGYLSFTPATDVQKVVVLSFPTTVGGAAARVIL
ncbi:DUF2391 family protein [Halosimplex aquaticum]|uniref:DUF2391 family protein n=1 Tax=Halosimplex aquaticum TaxID=3026162 RepID=A0ABD5Y8Z8_9EURY|nr:DUF2391 family protein [Halosimplex aquaticum]